MENEPVLFYGGGFNCFSNMSSYAVELDGILFMTSEHAYQYAKFSDPLTKEEIKNARSGYDAKMVSIEKEASAVSGWRYKAWRHGTHLESKTKPASSYKKETSRNR